MRVIAGSARSLPLKTIEGTDTRPTQDRIKETLFNMLQSDIPGCKFLDLYSGSGAIGIEALSRGAAKAVLVENSKRQLNVLRIILRLPSLLIKQMLWKWMYYLQSTGLRAKMYSQSSIWIHHTLMIMSVMY